MVIVMSPTPEDLAGMSEAVEHFFVQAFVSEFPVEALDEAILARALLESRIRMAGGKFTLYFCAPKSLRKRDFGGCPGESSRFRPLFSSVSPQAHAL
mgnify:CR=1 FL=1